jgi:hypothetical protein
MCKCVVSSSKRMHADPIKSAPVAKNKDDDQGIDTVARRATIPTFAPQPRAAIYITIRHVRYNHAGLSLPRPRCRSREQWYEVACTTDYSRKEPVRPDIPPTTVLLPCRRHHHFHLVAVGEYMSAIRDACRQNAPPASPYAVMDQQCSRTSRLPMLMPCSAPWCNHEASSMLTSPGSLILMTFTGRPVTRSYWLGVEAESAHHRDPKLYYWRPRAWRLRGARPGG